MAFDRNGNVTLTSPPDITPEAPTAHIAAVYLSAPGAIGNVTPSSGAFTTLTASGATTLSGLLNADAGIAVDTNAFTVANATGNTAIAGTLAVTGATTLTGALTANGGITCDTDKFTVADTTGNTAIGGTLAVTGVTTLSGLLNADAGIAVDTSAFTVANTSGNTAIAGTLAVTGATTLTALLTLTAGLKVSSTSRTATADGTGNGTIAVGTSFVTAANGGSADNIIVLPTAASSVGSLLFIYTTGALELRSDTPASVAINGGTGASAESAIPSGALVIAFCASATAWLALQIASNGTVAGVEAAA